VFTADELNSTDLHQVDPVTFPVIGHACQRHEVDWLHGCSWRPAVHEVQFANCSSVQFVCCEHGFTVDRLIVNSHEFLPRDVMHPRY